LFAEPEEKLSGKKQKKGQRISRARLLVQKSGSLRIFTEQQQRKWGGDEKSKAAVIEGNLDAMKKFVESTGDAEGDWISVENFALEEHDETEYAELLRQWERGEGQFEPLPVGIFLNMLRCYWIDPRKPPGASGDEAVGRGGHPVIKKLCNAVARMHRLAGMEKDSPTNHDLIIRFLNTARDTHLRVGHVGIDIVEDLPKFFEAAMSMPEWSSLQKLQDR
jgi:hypothetical protein